MRHALALLLAAALALGACSGTKPPKVDDVAGIIEPSPTGDGGGTDVSTAATDAPDVPATTPGGASGAEQEGSTSVAAANQALTAYLDALVAQDFETAQRMSTGGAQLMTRVRELVSRYNAEREGVSTLRYAARSFTVGSGGTTTVSFVGGARLELSVSGPAGDPYSESVLLEDPVVVLDQGAWRVADYRYEGQPLAHRPGSSSHRVAGVELRLGGAMGFGTTTGVVVDLVTDSDHGIKVDDVQLRYADGNTAPSTFGALIAQQPAALYFLFDRADAEPTAWIGTVTIDQGTTSEVTMDVVLSF